MQVFYIKAIEFLKSFEQKFLSGYDTDNLFIYKKTSQLMKINFVSLILILFTFIPIHFTMLSSRPILFIGDMQLVICFGISLLLIKYKKAQFSVVLTAVGITILIFLQNVVGDIMLPSQATASRYLESLVVITFSLPIIISFSYKKSHIYISAILSEFVLISHFIILKYIVRVNISGDMLLFIVFIVLLTIAGIMNLKVTNEAIKTLTDSKNRISEWNKVLEEKVEQRTIQLMESNQKLEAISQTDGLTNIANRRKFDTHLLSEWNRAKRSKSSIAIFIMDIDEFKLYNDTFGHQKGDMCLQMVAAKLQELTRRSGELAARYGGEEFAVIVPEIDSAEALDYGEKIRSTVESLAIEHSKQAKHSVVTVSIGVVVCQINSQDTMESCLKAADQALYRAKNLGRNRIVVA